VAAIAPREEDGPMRNRLVDQANPHDTVHNALGINRVLHLLTGLP
jgi:hypothetical protein